VVLSNLLGNPDQEFTTVLSLVLVSLPWGAELPGSRAAMGLAAVLTPFFVGMALEQALVPSDIARAERLEREQERQALEAAAAERP
jgi:hypothetical protein